MTTTLARPTLPLRERPRDYFFVAAFSFFAFSSAFSDLFHALDWIDESSFWGRANLAYAHFAQDHFLLGDHAFARFSTLVSAFVYGPFYLALVYAFVKGDDRIRIPAMLYVGAMLHGTLEFLYWEYVVGPAPGRPLVFWAFYGPYVLVPLLLAVRMRDPLPFAQR